MPCWTLTGYLLSAFSPITDHFKPTRGDDSFKFKNPSLPWPFTSSLRFSSPFLPPSHLHSLCFSHLTKRGRKKGLRHKSLLIDLKLCFETKPSGSESLYFNVKRDGGTQETHREINSLISEHIFRLHYAPEKVLIYTLQYINHPSNFQMRNASLTFMLFSISLLYGKEGNKDRFPH